MKAITLKGKSTSDISSQLNQIISEGYRPTLGIVFLSIVQDAEAITALMNSQNIQVFGATTSGEFIDGDIENGSITIMLLDINPDYFKLSFSETGIVSSYDNAKRLGKLGKETFDDCAFIIVSGWLSQDGEAIIEGITKGYGKDVTIFGGMAGDDLKLEGPQVFTNQKNSCDCEYTHPKHFLIFSFEKVFI